MSFGTVVEYEGVQIRNVQIRDFDQSIQADESGSDAMFSRFLISIEGIVHEEAAVLLLGVQGVTAVQALKNLEIHLQHTRGLFRMWFEGQLWIETSANVPVIEPSAAFIGGCDVNNGPKVHDLKVTHVAGYKSFRITATFELCVLLCKNWRMLGISNPKSNSGSTLKILPHFLIHNRWSLEESIDSEMHWQRVIRGKCRVLHSKLWTESVRYLVTPRLSPKFRFTGASYVMNKDALTMDYSHSSRQSHAAPPPPASTWEATHVEQAETGGGRVVAQFNLRLGGPPGVSKKDLLLAGLSVIEARFGYIPANAKDKKDQWSFTVIQASITDILHENELHFSLTLMRAMPYPGSLDSQKSWIGVTWDMLDRWPLWSTIPADAPNLLKTYDRTKWPEPIPWSDTGPAALFQSMFQSPCLGVPAALIAPIETKAQAKEEPTDYRTKTVDPTPKIYRDNYGEGITSQPNYTSTMASAEQSKAIYTHAEIESRYISDYGIAQLPYFMENESNPASSAHDRTPGATCKLIQYSQPTTKLSIWWRATRIGTSPAAPTSPRTFKDVNGINHVLDEKEVIPYPPQLLPDGVNFSRKIEMRLVYLLDRFIDDSHQMSAGTLPWDILKKEKTTVVLKDIEVPELI